MTKLNLNYDHNKMNEIAKELREDNRWNELSELEKNRNTLINQIDYLTEEIAESYILKLLPELSEFYGRPDISHGELVFKIRQVEPRILQESVEYALEILCENGKLEAEHFQEYSSLGDKIRYKILEEEKK